VLEYEPQRGVTSSGATASRASDSGAFMPASGRLPVCGHQHIGAAAVGRGGGLRGLVGTNSDERQRLLETRPRWLDERRGRYRPGDVDMCGGPSGGGVHCLLAAGMLRSAGFACRSVNAAID